MPEPKFCIACGREGHRSSSCPQRQRERDVEAHLVARVKAAGGTAYKFTSPGRVGVPDRLVVLPDRLFFAELKAPGKRATAGQAREHDRLRDLGQDVYVLDSAVAIDALMERA